MKILSLFSFLLLSNFLQAQDSIVRYWMYNPAAEQINIQTDDPSKAKTRAVYYFKDGLWKMESYYLSNGRLFMKASYKTAEGKINQGDYERFYENGNREVKAFYIDDKFEGLYMSWYMDGKRKDSLFMKRDLAVGKGNSLARSGKPALIYDLDEDGNGQVQYLNEDQSVASKGPLVNSRRQGKWVYFANEGYKEWEVNYEKDSVTAAICFNQEGIQQNDCIFEKEAEPQGGIKGWAAYLQKAIAGFDYPSRKLSRSRTTLSGEVWVKFLIEKDGSIADVQITKSLNPEADSIVRSVISRAPNWKPGIYRGKIVRSYHTQPVTFLVQ
jgi:antitoxin component YwqK of YwqJK toxin-antitoxin module